MVSIYTASLLLLSIYSKICKIHSFSFPNTISLTKKTTATQLFDQLPSSSSLETTSDQKFKHEGALDRRRVFENTGKILSTSLAATFMSPSSSNAMSTKSRTDGYQVQHSEREWAYMLSGRQYNILREGGTESPYSSILEGEERDGEYKCAGCASPLFASSSKFHSGTGWPSYASGLPSVEIANVNPVQANLIGAEIRCGTCGGHLGDVFSDGYLFVNTPAFATGKRFCVDGSALIFQPDDGSEAVFGDTQPPVKKSSMPDFLAPPKIEARNR
mmetsp:Transcript_17386/g.21253  ORF Transcript_17386/g.21253 Transcript_17386/m.21253 type:complete len:273 (-) Transcript_17386:181-999(-)